MTTLKYGQIYGPSRTEKLVAGAAFCIYQIREFDVTREAVAFSSKYLPQLSLEYPRARNRFFVGPNVRFPFPDLDTSALEGHVKFFHAAGNVRERVHPVCWARAKDQRPRKTVT